MNHQQRARTGWEAAEHRALSPGETRLSSPALLMGGERSAGCPADYRVTKYRNSDALQDTSSLSANRIAGCLVCPFGSLRLGPQAPRRECRSRAATRCPTQPLQMHPRGITSLFICSVVNGDAVLFLRAQRRQGPNPRLPRPYLRKKHLCVSPISAPRRRDKPSSRLSINQLPSNNL